VQVNEFALYRSRCPKCGLQMALARIEVIDQSDHDQRTFECVHCSIEIIKTVPYKYSKEPPQSA
jgi:hypothetical protein